MLIAGVDEAGRGPLVGSVVTAAVILDPEKPINGLADSKKLSEKKRLALAIEIRENAIDYSIAEATADEIDEINILHASMLAMKRAVEALDITPDKVLIDGNRCPDIMMPSTAIVGGDALEACISAASILAKVERDRQMLALHEIYPQYGFDRHKGYPTKLHREMLIEHGPLPIHRRSFGPVKKLLQSLA